MTALQEEEGENLSRPATAAIFGASGAIGKAIAISVAQSGRFAPVFTGSRQGQAPPAPSCAPFTFDLESEASIAAAASGLPRSLELVFVCTGMLHDQETSLVPEKTMRALHAETLARSYLINAIGPALIAKHVLPLLPKDRRAVFAVLSARVGSISDNRLGGWHAYRASKAALNMMMRNFAIELGRTHPQAIAVALHPGTVKSELSAPFTANIPIEKIFTPEYAAERLLDVVDQLSPKDSGGLFAWDGIRLPE